jgi:hypothetical protein
MNDAFTANGGACGTKKEMEQVRKENLKVSRVERKLDYSFRVLPLPE